MRMVLTDIEKLDGRFPGVITCVNLCLDQGWTGDEIAALLDKQYHVPMTRSTVLTYRRNRWVRQKRAVQARREAAEAIYDALGGHQGLDLLLFARLFELLTELKDVKLVVAVKEHVLKMRAQELKEEEFKLKSAQLQPGKTAGDKEADREEQSRNALRRIKEIFGLAGDGPPKPPVRQTPAVAGERSP